MAREPLAVPMDMKAQELLDRMSDPERPEYQLRSFPVVDASRRVLAVVTRKDLHRARTSLGERTVLEVGTRDPVVVHPGDPCSLALERMVTREVGHPPVADDGDVLVGYMSRGDLLRNWKRKIEEERERGLGLRLRRAARETFHEGPKAPARRE